MSHRHEVSPNWVIILMSYADIKFKDFRTSSKNSGTILLKLLALQKAHISL